MALSDKNILITPNRSQTADPKIEFVGANGTLGPQTITLRVYPTSSGTISLEGSAGQLFSVTNTLTGTIYSVNDVSGIPSIEVLDTGLVKFAQYSGNVLVGTGIDYGNGKVQLQGSFRAGSGWNTSPASTLFSHTLSAVSGASNRVVNFDGNGNTPSVWWTNGSRAYGAIDAGDPGLTFWANNGSSWQKQISLGYGTVNVDTALQQGGNQVLHAGNYSSYALPLSGGTVTGNTRINQLGVGSSNNTSFDFYNNGSSYFNGSVTIDDNLSISSGFNITVGGSTVLHAGNYNSYAPTLTGGGASGTWGINITGNAATITSQANSATITASTGVNANDIVRRDGNGYIFANHVNFNTGVENPTIANFITDNGDGWSRKSSLAHVKNQIRGVADGTWSINVSGSAGSAGWATYAQIIDTRAGQYTPNDYQDNRATFEFTNQIVSDWHSAITMQGWSNGYAAWQIIGGATTSTHENWYLRSGVNTAWGSLRTILHSGNYNSYSPTLTGGGASGTWGINITGSAGSVSSVAASAITGQVGMWTSAARPGPYRLYRRDDNSDYSVQTYWTGSYWRLYGYSSGDTAHADTHVGYADNSGYATSAGTAGQIDGIEFRNGDSSNGTGPDNITNNGTGYVTSVSLFGQTDGAIYSQAHSSSWVHQIYGDYRTGQLAVRGRNSGTWQSWRAILDATNYSSYALPLSGGTMTGSIAMGGNNVTGAGLFGLGNGFQIQQGGSDYGRFNSWVHLNGYYGFYESNNGAHFYPNNGTYGAWRIEGTRNGWRGLEFTANNGHISLMIDPSSNTSGFHNNSYGWQFRWSDGTAYVNKNSYGGGTQATVLDSSNYNNYSPTLAGGGASGTWGINITGTATDPNKVPLTGGTMTGTLFINSKLRVNTASGPSDNAYGTATDIPMYMFGSTRTQSTFLIENNVNSSIDYPVIVIRRTLTPVGSRFGGMIRFADKNSSGTEISSQIYSFNRLTSQDLFLDAGSGTNDRVVLRAGSSSSMQVAETFIMNVKAVIYTYSGFTSSLDIDCREGNYFTRTISSDSTFTFSNVPAASGFNVAYSFTLELTHTSGTVTWPSTVKWPGNIAPTLTTGKTHLFMFVTDDAGSRWRGSYLTNYDN
jgi:hypothetical protein